MEDFLDLLNDFVKSSQNAQSQLPKRKMHRWKYCVALAAKGWKAHNCIKVKDDDPFHDDVVVVWRKEGEEEIEIRLSFTEQCLWLEYMEQKEKQNEKEG